MTLLLARGRGAIGIFVLAPRGTGPGRGGRNGLRIEADRRSAVDPVDRHRNISWCSVIDIVVLGGLRVMEDVAKQGPLTGRQSCCEGVQPLTKDHGLVFRKVVCAHCIYSWHLPPTRLAVRLDSLILDSR
jgi:hypothetical protein